MSISSVFTMGSSEGVPPGAYTGEFVGHEPTEPIGEMGVGIRWKWRITSGAHAGRTVQRITGSKPAPKNACGKVLAGLAGSLGEGETFDVASVVGRRYTLMITAGPSGGTRVEAIAPATA